MNTGNRGKEIKRKILEAIAPIMLGIFGVLLAIPEVHKEIIRVNKSYIIVTVIGLLVLHIAILIYYGCVDARENEEIDSLNVEIDSLNEEIDSLKDSLNEEINSLRLINNIQKGIAENEELLIKKLCKTYHINKNNEKESRTYKFNVKQIDYLCGRIFSVISERRKKISIDVSYVIKYTKKGGKVYIKQIAYHNEVSRPSTMGKERLIATEERYDATLLSSNNINSITLYNKEEVEEVLHEAEGKYLQYIGIPIQNPNKEEPDSVGLIQFIVRSEGEMFPKKEFELILETLLNISHYFSNIHRIQSTINKPVREG